MLGYFLLLLLGDKDHEKILGIVAKVEKKQQTSIRDEDAFNTTEHIQRWRHVSFGQPGPRYVLIVTVKLDKCRIHQQRYTYTQHRYKLHNKVDQRDIK